MMTEADIQSPCIGVCSMDNSTGFCLGCYRTIEEIQGWWNMDSNQQKEVVQQASQRLEQQFS